MTDASRPLNERQELFCRAYVASGFNATEAATTAGYSERTAYSMGSRLLKHVEVQKRIAELKAPLQARLEVTAERWLEEVALVAFARLGDVIHVTADGDPYIDLNKMTDHHRAALDKAEIEDFVDRREVDAEGNVIARDVRRVKAGMSGKLKALQMMGTHLGLLTQKVDVTVSDNFAAELAAAKKRARAGREPT